MGERVFHVYQVSKRQPAQAIETTGLHCESQVIDAIKKKEGIDEYKAAYRPVTGVSSSEEAIQKALENGFEYRSPENYVSASLVKPPRAAPEPG